jgi:hypothetical protein
MDLGVTPLVQRISLGQAVALLKGRRARRADLTGGSLSNRASDGDCGQPKSCDGRCQPKLVAALANNLATLCLSGFGDMSSSWPRIGCHITNLRRD